MEFMRVFFLKLLEQIKVGIRSATLISRKAKQQPPPEGQALDIHPGLRRHAMGVIQGQLLASNLSSASEPQGLEARAERIASFSGFARVFSGPKGSR